jgi:hypothetical protein
MLVLSNQEKNYVREEARELPTDSFPLKRGIVVERVITIGETASRVVKAVRVKCMLHEIAIL